MIGAVADLAFAQGDFARAASLYNGLLLRQPDDAALTESAGLSHLHLGRWQEAETLLRRAATQPGASWQAWNGIGVIADRKGEWSVADDAYARAALLAPSQAEVANNRGWSLLLRGRWAAAEAELMRGFAIDATIGRLTNNLDLARAAQASALPTRRPAETAESWAARLNDAGVVAAVRCDHARAIAAFARAIESQSRWNGRAAANLAAVEALAGGKQ